MKNKRASEYLFVLVAAFVLSPWASPPVALFLGLVLALTIGNPYAKQTKKLAKTTLQIAVVGLGFGLNFMSVVKVSGEGFIITFITITVTLALGLWITRMFGVGQKTGVLISAGTAICGGSAIAAVGPAIDASDEDMSIALGTVFILNSVALLLFPVLGHLFGLSQEAFGLWAALAIHDTSSVVGATTVYGEAALAVGTTVKLARALWIIPVTLFLAYLHRKSRQGGSREAPKVQIPWFIGLFLLASIMRTAVDDTYGLMSASVTIAKLLLTLTLFLIGAGLSRAILKQVGFKPFLAGVTLWVIVGVGTLAGVMYAVAP